MLMQQKINKRWTLTEWKLGLTSPITAHFLEIKEAENIENGNSKESEKEKLDSKRAQRICSDSCRRRKLLCNKPRELSFKEVTSEAIARILSLILSPSFDFHLFSILKSISSCSSWFLCFLCDMKLWNISMSDLVTGFELTQIFWIVKKKDGPKGH